MHPFIKKCQTEYTHGHNKTRKAEYQVHYYQSRFSHALREPPPDIFFKTRLVGDTYTNRVADTVQIWYRDIEYNWKAAAEEQEHPYLTLPKKDDPTL